jgi:hypothetical protein
MKLKLILTALLLIWAIAVAPVRAAELPESVKTYPLNISPNVAKQTVTFDPPATHLKVKMIKPGDVGIPCGYKSQTYTCTAGKALDIVPEDGDPIEKFWGQNTTDKMVFLTLTVEETASELPVGDDGVEGVAPAESEHLQDGGGDGGADDRLGDAEAR